MVKPFKKEHVEKSSSSRVTYLYWEQMERGGGGGKQVYSRAEGWLVKGLLRALTSSSLSCLLSCHPWAPWWMLTVTAVLRPPQPITPLTHQPPPLPPHSSSPLHSAPCPALTVARLGAPRCGGKMSELGCQKHIQDVICHPSMIVPFWWAVVSFSATGKSLRVSENCLYQ